MIQFDEKRVKAVGYKICECMWDGLGWDGEVGKVSHFHPRYSHYNLPYSRHADHKILRKHTYVLCVTKVKPKNEMHAINCFFI